MNLTFEDDHSKHNYCGAARDVVTCYGESMLFARRLAIGSIYLHDIKIDCAIK